MVRHTAEYADGCRVQRKVLPLGHGQSDPANGQRRADVTVQEERNIAGQGPEPRQQPVDPRSNLIRALAVRTSIAPQTPVGPVAANVDRAPTFVVPIVPFLQIAVDLAVRRQAGELTGSPRTQHWAREHLTEMNLPKPHRQRTRIRFTLLSQRDIGAPGMLTRERPCGLAMADQIQLQRFAQLRSIAAAYSPRRAALLSRARRSNACCAAALSVSRPPQMLMAGS